MGATVYSNIERGKTTHFGTYTTRSRFYSSSIIHKTILQLVDQSLLIVPKYVTVSALKFITTDFNNSKLLATGRQNDSKVLSKSYKISTDPRPSVISTSLLSLTALIFFREIVRKKVRHQRSHYLLGQIYDKSSQHYHKMRVLRLIFKGSFWS